MAYDLEEQEQIAQLKAFGQKWGKWIGAGALLGVLVFAGFQGKSWYDQRQTAQAQAVFVAFSDAMTAKQDAQAHLNTLQSSFAKTNYASLATLQMAANWASAGQFDQAQSALRWVMAHGQTENQGMARVRLAEVLVQINQRDEALKVLDVPVTGFGALFASKKADIYAMNQEFAKSRELITVALATARHEKPIDGYTLQTLETKLKYLPQ